MDRGLARLKIALVWAVLLLIPGWRVSAADNVEAQHGDDAWLRYSRLSTAAADRYRGLPSDLVVRGNGKVLKSAQQELTSGFETMLGRTLHVRAELPKGPVMFIGKWSDLQSRVPGVHPAHELRADGFWLKDVRAQGRELLIVTGASESGVLYGVFHLLSIVARCETLADVDDEEEPFAPVRWINQWDNLDGSIERGYGGASIFFEHGEVRQDLTRVAEYGRLLASVGINGCTINNVNADPKILDRHFIPQIARVADALRPWGVRMSVSVDLSTPKRSGELDTFDPIDARVAEWWHKKADEIYRQIPDFAGFLVKADSEGRAGPSAYGRTHADAANVIARALKPHGGIVLYRAFVYNHHLDWTNLKNDRAKAAYDNFHPVDGQFDDNAVVQIKNGPIDFQVREPASPLFGGLSRTNQAIELQITQEYTGQQKHLCFLVPMWKEVLDFDMRVGGKNTPVKDLVAGRVFERLLGGFAGVSNVGMDTNWMGSPMAQANLYGFGRLAWNPDLSAETITDEWTRLTFGNDPLVVQTITKMQLESWHIYESYTGPLGAGTLTNITGNHYDPAPESSERNGWGQWHRADHEGIGMDRTVATGTGFIGQYPPDVANVYESLATCPDELLLFFHHVAWTYKLHTGKTVIQHIYDSHYDGVEGVQEFVKDWKSLQGHLDEARYRDVLSRLEYQAGQAIVWRDTICKWAYQVSGIPDQRERVRADN
jgi:alpha-glucuronidase